MTGVTSIGAYLPRLRLARSSIAAAMGWLAPGLAGGARGHRTLGFWDEDSLTMAVAASRDCLLRTGRDDARMAISSLALASVTPPFAERQNASIVHAALQLRKDCIALDAGGTPRSGLLCLHQALEGGREALVVAADRPIAPAGSTDEMRSGDGAAAAAVGSGPALLDYLGGASLASAITDRNRRTGASFATSWEERWVREEGFVGLVPQAIAAALENAGVAAADVDWFVMPATIAGVGPAVAAAAGLSNAQIADTLASCCGDTGSGHALLMLARAMEEMRPGDIALVAQFGQGATALAFRATGDIARMRPTVSAQIDNGLMEENYLKLAVFSGLLPWDKGLRARSNPNDALSVAHRYGEAVLGFVGSRWRETGTVQFPPSQISAGPQVALTDTPEPWPLADLGGRIASRTADGLAFSRHPPSCYGLVDFDGGGRLMMDFTDPEAASLGVGDRVRFVFRIKDLDEQTGHLRYFWKAVPAAGGTAAADTIPAVGERDAIGA